MGPVRIFNVGRQVVGTYGLGGRILLWVTRNGAKWCPKDVISWKKATDFSDFFSRNTSSWFQIKLPTIYTTVWRMPIGILSYSETLSGENKLDPIRERRESAGKPTQWPGTARIGRSQDLLGDRIRPPPYSLSRSIYFFGHQLP